MGADPIPSPAPQDEELFRRKVLRTFMPNGYCEAMPAQHKKRLVVYAEILSQFEPGRQYPEKEVNEIISRMHADYCTVRRDFVGLGWMTRDKGIYTALENAAAQGDPQ